MRAIRVITLILTLTVLAGCRDEELPKPTSKLLDANGNFTLHISNQSFAIDPVDVRVEMDGELIVADYFHVGTQHTWASFKLALAKGGHKIRMWSVKGDAELSTEFELNDHDMGVLQYWYSPKPLKKDAGGKFSFKTGVGPLHIL